jgi:DNA ligase 4
MPFKFQIFCDLLDNLSRAQTKVSSTTSAIADASTRIVNVWFDKHDSIIPRHGSEAVAFLSCMFPERRADRVYNLREAKLEAIVQHALGLGTTRLKELRWWEQTNGADFASSVEHIISATDSEARPGASVTLEEIDEVLDRVAAASPFSAVDLRNKINTKYPSHRPADNVLSVLLRKLHSSEAKWLIRMVLKTYSPARVPEAPAMRRFHFLLPDVLSFQNSFEAVVQLLQSPTIRRMPTRVAIDVEELLKQSIAVNLRPQIGVMVTQATHAKARGITHCCQMAGSRRMSVERKYDGEYCQIHIDLSKDNDPIRIFSKSGRDSTDDRIGLHGAQRQP